MWTKKWFKHQLRHVERLPPNSLLAKPLRANKIQMKISLKIYRSDNFKLWATPLQQLMLWSFFKCHNFPYWLAVVRIHIVTCTYKSTLEWVWMYQSSWISILLTHIYSKFHEWLLTIHCWFLIRINSISS